MTEEITKKINEFFNTCEWMFVFDVQCFLFFRENKTIITYYAGWEHYLVHFDNLSHFIDEVFNDGSFSDNDNGIILAGMAIGKPLDKPRYGYYWQHNAKMQRTNKMVIHIMPTRAARRELVNRILER